MKFHSQSPSSLRLLPVVIISIFFLFLALINFESSPSTTNRFKITWGSSISTYSSSPNNNNELKTSTTTTSSYWLSPLGNFAFGFYPLCSNSSSSCRFVVGIWLAKSVNKTLVWMANPNDPPLSHPSSLLFNEGRLTLRTRDGEKLLMQYWSYWAYYASMLDNGNFILQRFDSSIIWQSFDHPTNTILGGQTLSSEQSLVASFSNKFDPAKDKNYELRIKHDGLRLYDLVREERYLPKTPNRDHGINSKDKVRPIRMKLDSITGRLCIVDSWDMVLKNLTDEVENQPQPKHQQHEVLFRATLDGDGYFRLYKEIIEIEGKEDQSMVVWQWPEIYEESVFTRLMSEPIGNLAFCSTVIFGLLSCFFILQKLLE